MSGGSIDYLPTDLISGTKSGSRIAYEAPLHVVPISNARTSFLEGPEYGERVIAMAVRREMPEERGCGEEPTIYNANGGPPQF